MRLRHRRRFGAVFLWDSGSSVGEIIGHSRPINSVDMRQQRPYRIVTASEDFHVGYFEGPPFKFKQSMKEHTRFVNCVRYAPDGSRYVSVGSDVKGILFDGKSGEKIGELGNATNKHDGGIMSVSWSPDGRQLLTASADKTAKLWDVERNTVVSTFTFGTTVEDQQLGTLWQGAHLLTVALSGYINYLDVNNPAKPHRVLRGHNKNITALAVDDRSATLYTGSYDGRVCAWNASSGASEVFSGKGHTNEVTDMLLLRGALVTGGMDDVIRTSDAASRQFGYVCRRALRGRRRRIDARDRCSDQAIPVDGAPRAISAPSRDSDLLVVAARNAVEIIRDGQKVGSMKPAYEPQAVAVAPSVAQVAVGGLDGKLYLYALHGDQLSECAVHALKGAATDVAFSPDGRWLAAADAQRCISLFDAASGEPKDVSWVYHTARINSIAWSPNSRYLASGGLDTNVYIWCAESPNNRIAIKSAHPVSVSRVAWLDDATVVSAGHDCCVRSWALAHAW